MVSKARLDLPDPDRPVNTISASRGRSSEMLRRLCSRAPRTTRRFSCKGTDDRVDVLTDSSEPRERGRVFPVPARPSGLVERTRSRRRTRRRACAREHYRERVTEPSPTPQLAELRALVVAATQRLLGSTIVVSDEEWAAPSRLPGWSRGHVATHLARQADGLGRLVDGAATGVRQPMYDSPEARTAEIEQGAGRTGLELQTDLDTSAERLTEAFERLDRVGPGGVAGRTGWSSEVEMR